MNCCDCSILVCPTAEVEEEVGKKEVMAAMSK